MHIQLQQITKKYNRNIILSDVSFDIKEGELVALLGPSGSGKTTILKIIAGIENTNTGQVIIDNKNVTKLLPKDRNIGFVFQHYALFKHMNVFNNVAFGLRVKEKLVRKSEKEIKKKVEELLDLVQVKHLAYRMPHELSGGQRQRVALARALAVEPKVLLLDEPFSALDAKLKHDLRRWLKKLQKTSNITIILVTHDQEEALDIADKIVILNKGKIEQIGTPDQIYHSPDNEFVYNFLGHYNVFKAIRDEKGQILIVNNKQANFSKPQKWYNQHKLVSAFASIFKTSSSASINQNINEYFDVFVRPHDMEVTKKPNDDLYIKANISHLNSAGPIVKLELESPDYELIKAEITKEMYDKYNFKIGDVVFTKAKQITLFT